MVITIMRKKVKTIGSHHNGKPVVFTATTSINYRIISIEQYHAVFPFICHLLLSLRDTELISGLDSVEMSQNS